MLRILAIASLAIRAAIRSRLLVFLLLLLLGAVIGLPLTVQGDGTPEGHVRIVLGYTMGFASVVLSLTALWSGALTISREVADKQIQMVCSKPVSRFEIWLGKWLGLVAVHATLLAVSAVATYATLQASLNSNRFTEAQRAHLRTEVLTARRPQKPPLPDVEANARAILKDRLDHQQLPEGMSPDKALQNLRQELTVQSLIVAPGGQLEWTFTLPPDLPPDAELRLKYRFSASTMSLATVQGTWRAGKLFRAMVTNTPSVTHTLSLPASSADGNPTLRVRYLNDNPEPVTLVFPPANGVELLLPAGTFPANFARAVLMVFLRLALFCAIGITAGTLFSTPVAVLMSLAAVIFVQAGSYISTLTQEERLTPWSVLGQTEPGIGDHLLRLLFRFIDLLMAPLQTGSPMDQAAIGLIVEPFGVARAFLIQVVLYSGLLAFLSTFVFNRRELALPTT